MDLKQFKDVLFARATAAGFADMELYYSSGERFSTNVFKGEIDKYTISVEGGLSFRGLFGGKMGYAYTEKIDEDAIDPLITGAKESASIIDSDEVVPLYEGPFAYDNVELYSDKLDEVGPERKIAFLKEMEAEAFRLDPRVQMVNYCQFGSSRGVRFIANSRGLEVHEQENGAYTYVAVVVRQEQETRTWMAAKVGRDFAQFDAKSLAKEAVDEALAYLGAEPVQSGSPTVLLRADAAATLLGTFASIFSAANVQKGKSRLKGKLNGPVAAGYINIIDDPFLPEGAASRGFDSEGVPSRKLHLVENGVLKSYMHNLKTAGIDGVPSTGHGFKLSYKGAVQIAPSNMYIQPGAKSRQELIESMGEGLIITDLQGTHSGANPISGDFSLAALGYLVQGGRIVRPVNQITVAGNFYDLLSQIEEVGSDLEFGFPMGGHFGSPTLKIRGLAITGK